MRLASEAALSFALGVNDSTAPSEYQPQEMARLIKGDVSLQGNSVRRRGRLALINSNTAAGTGMCLGAIAYTTAAGVQQLFMFTGEYMMYSTNDGRTWTQAASGLREDFWSLVIIREGSANVLGCA